MDSGSWPIRSENVFLDESRTRPVVRHGQVSPGLTEDMGGAEPPDREDGRSARFSSTRRWKWRHYARRLEEDDATTADARDRRGRASSEKTLRPREATRGCAGSFSRAQSGPLSEPSPASGGAVPSDETARLHPAKASLELAREPVEGRSSVRTPPLEIAREPPRGVSRRTRSRHSTAAGDRAAVREFFDVFPTNRRRRGRDEARPRPRQAAQAVHHHQIPRVVD